MTIGSFFFPEDLPYVEHHIMPATMALGADLRSIVTMGSLQSGIAFAMSQQR